MKSRQSAPLPPKLSPDRKAEASQGIWSGTISFSLVAIPVRLVKAVEPGRVSFRLLHTKDNSPLTRRMVCPEEDRIVPDEEIVRGYDLGQDHYLVVTDEELQSVSPERSRTIEIMEFIDLRDVDQIYYDHPYYLTPMKGGEKSYKLLVEVMRRTRKAGLAKFVMGEREYLVAVKSTEGVLSLTTLHYSSEILSPDDLARGDGTVEPDEKDRVKAIIKGMTADFDPDKYANVRREGILKILRDKAKQSTPVESPVAGENEGYSPVDLIAVLEKSMRKVKKSR